MRSYLALALSMSLCASASAATLNHSRTHHHVTASHRQGVTSGFAIPSWAYAAPRPPVGGGFGGGGNIDGINLGHIGEVGDPRLYPYDPDCNDFFFRHPDYQWQPSCN